MLGYGNKHILEMAGAMGIDPDNMDQDQTKLVLNALDEKYENMSPEKAADNDNPKEDTRITPQADTTPDASYAVAQLRYSPGTPPPFTEKNEAA